MYIYCYKGEGKIIKDGTGTRRNSGKLKVYKNKKPVYKYSFSSKKNLKTIMARMVEMYGECEISVMFDEIKD